MFACHLCPIGAFGPCLNVTDSTAYHEGCIYDVCETLPDVDVVCDSLESFAKTCRSAGQRVDNWRSETPLCRE